MHYIKSILLSLLTFLVAASLSQSWAAKLDDMAWDRVCGFGQDKSQGCAAVRAREIVDASKYPWSAIGRINYAGYRLKQHCTGALISERLVLTAAHCLYNKQKKRWIPAENIHFVAGYQKGENAGHSRAKGYVLSKTQKQESKIFLGNPWEDWAVLELQEPVGASTGYLGWDVIGGKDLASVLRNGGKITFAGYPRIRKYVMSVDRDCGEARILKKKSLLIHRCTVMQGDSGGPILLLEDGKITIIGINVGGVVQKGKVEFVSAPIAVVYKSILESLGNETLLKDRGSRFGLPGSFISK